MIAIPRGGKQAGCLDEWTSAELRGFRLSSTRALAYAAIPWRG